MIGAKAKLDRARFLAADRRHTLHRIGEILAGHNKFLVIAARDHAFIFGEGAVNQLAGERDGTECELHLGVRKPHHNLIPGFFRKLANFIHGLARDDDAGHGLGPFRQR